MVQVWGGGGQGASFIEVDIKRNDGAGGGAGGSYVNPTYFNPNSIYFLSSSNGPSLVITWTVNPVLQYDIGNNVVFYNTKTFVIDHPLYVDKYLVHACLEGPEAGVYYRGSATILSDNKSVDIYLADYVQYIASDFTIHVTPILTDGNLPYFPTLITTRIIGGKFTVYSNIMPCEFDYVVFGKRQSVEVEPTKSTTLVRGDGPYKYCIW